MAQRGFDSEGVYARMALRDRKVVPSSSGVDGFVRIQTMGATLSEVSVQWCTLWVLTAVYFGLACLGMRNIIRRVENRQE